MINTDRLKNPHPLKNKAILFRKGTFLVPFQAKGKKNPCRIEPFYLKSLIKK